MYIRWQNISTFNIKYLVEIKFIIDIKSTRNSLSKNYYTLFTCTLDTGNHIVLWLSVTVIKSDSVLQLDINNAVIISSR